MSQFGITAVRGKTDGGARVSDAKGADRFGPIGSAGEVDEQILKEARSHIGKVATRTSGKTEACHDNLRCFAWGIGDLNPLWIDLEYGRRSIFGTNLAPPTFFYCVYTGGPELLPGLPYLVTLEAGVKVRLHDRLRLGDHGLRAEAEVTDAELVTSRRGVKRILWTTTTKYFGRSGSGKEKCWAEIHRQFFRMAPSVNNKSVSYEPREQQVWSEEQLEALGKETLAAEARRADQIRYWEDLSLGDRLGPLPRGPYTLWDHIAYHVGSAIFHPAFDGWWLHTQDDQSAYPDSLDYPRRWPINGPWGVANGHWDLEVARRAGQPGLYDYGNHRGAVIMTLVTNWMGDAGFLREFSIRNRRPVITGDVMRISGAIEELVPQDLPAHEVGSSSRAVKIRLEVFNQLDELVSEGTALVELPRRGAARS